MRIPSKTINVFRFALVLPAALLLLGSAKAPAETASLNDSMRGRYLIQGHFTVDVPKQDVWQVLTDYPGLKGVVSSMEASEVLERKDGEVLVKQQACGSFLCFTRSIHLLLRVKETPFSLISFEDDKGGSFRLYRGSWKLEEAPGGVKVNYELEVNRGSLAPEFLEKRLFRGNALDLLRELRVEILRRTALPAQDGAVTQAAASPAP